MDAHYDTFVKKGAEYCESLFSANKNFYDANSLVESIIATSGVASERDLEKIVSLFNNSASLCSEAAVKCNDFTNFSNNYPGQVNFIDDSKMIFLLSEAQNHLEKSAALIRGLRVGQDLQEQIWADSRISEAFMGAAEVLCKAVLWQISSAQRSHGE